MENDKLHKVSWKAGEFEIHGNSRKYLLHVLAEYLMEEGSNRVTIEPVDEKEESKSESRFEQTQHE